MKVICEVSFRQVGTRNLIMIESLIKDEDKGDNLAQLGMLSYLACQKIKKKIPGSEPNRLPLSGVFSHCLENQACAIYGGKE